MSPSEGAPTSTLKRTQCTGYSIIAFAPFVRVEEPLFAPHFIAASPFVARNIRGRRRLSGDRRGRRTSECSRNLPIRNCEFSRSNSRFNIRAHPPRRSMRTSTSRPAASPHPRCRCPVSHVHVTYDPPAVSLLVLLGEFPHTEESGLLKTNTLQLRSNAVRSARAAVRSRLATPSSPPLPRYPSRTAPRCCSYQPISIIA